MVPRRATAVAALLLAFLMGNGCEIRDEQVQSGSRGGDLQRLLPANRGGDGQIVNHDAHTTIEYVENYQAGLERATASGRPLVVICRASWCR